LLAAAEIISVRDGRAFEGDFMRTRITCGWLVAHADGHHTLWRNAELVYEGNTVLFVGERFEGAVDREIDARDKLVAPGFIDTHVHSGHRASHRLISDVGRADYFGQPFLEISVAREGTRVGGDPRYVRPDDNSVMMNCFSTRDGRSRNSCATASPRSSNSGASCASSRRCSRSSANWASAPISAQASTAAAGSAVTRASSCA
jgi:hypothetical protein